jgi:MFS family permease
MLVYFSTQIFSQLGYSAMLSGILAGVMNTIFAVASFPPIWFIERVGRRAMMFWGAIGCGVLMVIYISLTTLKNPTTATNWASVVIIILYNVVFAFGWLGTCWVSYGSMVSSFDRY